MPLTDDGRDLIAQAIVGESVTSFSNADAHIGVGDSDAAFDPTHADLQGSSLRKSVESGYPSRTDNELTFRATFDEGDANHAWEEWGVFNQETGGVMLNRALESLGTKTSSQSWQFTVTIAIEN